MKRFIVLKLAAIASLLFGCEISIGTSSGESQDTNNSENIQESINESTSSTESNSLDSTNSLEGIESGNVTSEEIPSEENEYISSETIKSEDAVSSEESSLQVNNKFTKYGSVSESIYAEWNDSNASKATVSYRLSGTADYKQVDKELVRNLSNDENKARFDILGLASGKYDVKVVTSSNETLEMKNVAVANYDRSGFAHYKNSKGVGGYNNDGTPRSNADIIYVTEDNKNTVTYNGNKGLVNILSNVGSKTLIIRIIGRIATRSYDQDSKTYKRDDALGITDLNNLSNKDSGDASYWNMCNFSSSTGGLTIEGVGEDAEIFQWGMTIKNIKYVEVRNLTFTDYPEDACAIEGKSSDCTDAQYIWIHNNVFNAGKNYVDQTTEQDKPNGDGATDMKQCMNITLSYNKYNKCHKTGLVGGGDSQLSNKITFHHNYYNQCKSRLPLGRQANMHMYNNYYYKISGTVMSIRANAYVLSEYNYFESSSNPVETKSSGVVKSYNDIFKSCSGSNDNSSSNSSSSKPSSSESSSSVSSSTPTTGEVITFNAADLESGENISSNKSSGIFTVTATSDKTITISDSSEFKSFDSSYTKIVNLGGSGTENYRSIKFELESSAKIYIYAKSNGSERKIKIGGDIDYTFPGITDPTELSYELEAGSYYVCSSNSGMSIAAIKIVY